MNKRILAGLATLAISVVAAGAQAGERHSHDRHHDHGYAQVLHVQPILERVRHVVPVQHCWKERGSPRFCETRHEQRWDLEVVAYRVTYVHQGRLDVVRLAWDPGRRLHLDDVRRRG